MNVLFFLFQKIDSSSGTLGGIERHTLLLQEGLTQKNFHFFFSYSHTDDYLMLHPEIIRDDVVSSSELFITKSTDPNKVREYLIKHQIDVIHIQQNDGFESKIFQEARAGLPIRIVATYHFCPGYELNDLNAKNSIIRFRQEKSIGKKLKWLKRLLLLPYYRKKKEQDLKEKFAIIYSSVDKLALLSSHYIPLFKNICLDAKKDGGQKLDSINNCVTFDTNFDPANISSKNKNIVIVARLEEAYKRLSIAINFWKQIVATGRFLDWTMTIVGDGYSMSTYKKMIQDLPRITLEGRQPSESYFDESSIYLNTSINEGFCLSCVEAMQKGVVPFSFNSWPAVFDMIDDGINGYIINEGDLDDYLHKIMDLMDDKEKRESMAKAAIEKSKKFSKEIFLKKYLDLYFPEE